MFLLPSSAQAQPARQGHVDTGSPSDVSRPANPASDPISQEAYSAELLSDDSAADAREAAGTCQWDYECWDGNGCTYDRCVHGQCFYIPRRYGDLNNDGVVDVFDLVCYLYVFCDPDPCGCGFRNIDISPCNGNGVINIFDLFAVMNAFQGLAGPGTTDCGCALQCDSDLDCTDGLFCNGTEICVDNTCLPGAAPCADQVCHESTDTCAPCADNADCRDGLFCSGIETCVEGTCQPGLNPCPGQQCDEVANECVTSDTLISGQLSSTRALPGESVELEIIVQDVRELEGFQVAIAITRTSGAGQVGVPCPDGVQVDPDREDYVFFSPSGYPPVADCPNRRLAAVSIYQFYNVGGPPGYLATFILEASDDVTHGSTFDISILPFPASILLYWYYLPILFEIGPVCTLTIEEPDCQENGLPDRCDMDCGPPGGDCDRPGCGGSGDCDGDGIPDECDAYGDVNHDTTVNVFDLLCVLDGFAGAFDNCTFEDADLEPCGGNGTINIFDLFAVLNAFAGIDPCGCP